MKLSKLYANKTKQFEPIDFASGLNVLLAEIRLPENKKKDTHNLGKTTLGRLIDYMLLAGKDPRFFLFKHRDRFQDFIFFLELELLDGGYLTIKRGVEDATKISFKKHVKAKQDFSAVGEGEWDHPDVAFERAKELLDGILDLRALKPWPFRNTLGYFLRTQEDFRDVFQLRKFIGKHSEWKPLLAQTLGFNATIIKSFYQKEELLSERQASAETIQAELGGSIQDISKIEGILLLKKKEAEKKQALLDAFDFRFPDKNKTKQVVDELDTKIAALNNDRYNLNHSKKRINAALEEDEILFRPEEAAQLFKEVGVLFAGQLKKDFQQLIDFNKAITEERRAYLQEERQEVEADLKKITNDLAELGRRRSEMLSFLTSTDIFLKYKQTSNELVTLRADIETLERQRGFLHRLQELRTEIRNLTEERAHLQTKIENDVEEQNSDPKSLFSTIRLFFNEIIEQVIDRKALLSVAPNTQGHLEFRAEILDETGKATSADLGTTYRKLLCLAFDMAVLRAHLDKHFPRFAFHDGVFEALDDRKKDNLLDVIREYTQLGLQLIITAIDSDLPPRGKEDPPVFSEGEIVLRLHDEGDDGRLFRMQAW